MACKTRRLDWIVSRYATVLHKVSLAWKVLRLVNVNSTVVYISIHDILNMHSNIHVQHKTCHSNNFINLFLEINKLL